MEIPAGVTVSVAGSKVSAKGKLGELSIQLPSGTGAVVEGSVVKISRSGDEWEQRSVHGLARTLVDNLLIGVSKGYLKELEIQGVGFKAAVQGRNLVISLGFSHPVEYLIPEGIKIAVDAGTKLVVSGADKQGVGNAAARIRGYFKAEPYKGKGLRYKGEYVRQKVGKTVA